jgi:hypothetical protein
MRFSSLKIVGLRAPIFFTLAVFLAVGCGPASGTIKGKVKYGDANLKAGHVSFVSEDGSQTGHSRIAEDGTYTIEKMPIGPVKISVETQTLVTASKARKNEPPPGQARPGGSQDDESAKLAIPIPPKYADPKTSGLTYTVTSGSQSHDIELK